MIVQLFPSSGCATFSHPMGEGIYFVERIPLFSVALAGLNFVQAVSVTLRLGVLVIKKFAPPVIQNSPEQPLLGACTAQAFGSCLSHADG